MDFKIGAEKKGTSDWDKKQRTITEFARTLVKAFPFKDIDTIIIPVPPSKTRDDPSYDDRMIIFLNQFCADTPRATLKDIISISESMNTAHLTGDRLPPEELAKYLRLNMSFSLDDKVVIIADDVITHGSHYKACEQLILSKFKPRQIMGLFIGSSTI